jgi:hypothetical protein
MRNLERDSEEKLKKRARNNPRQISNLTSQLIHSFKLPEKNMLHSIRIL